MKFWKTVMTGSKISQPTYSTVTFSYPLWLFFSKANKNKRIIYSLSPVLLLFYDLFPNQDSYTSPVNVIVLTKFDNDLHFANPSNRLSDFVSANVYPSSLMGFVLSGFQSLTFVLLLSVLFSLYQVLCLFLLH